MLDWRNARFLAFTERQTHGKKPVFRHSHTFSLCFLEFSETVNSRKGMFSNGKQSVNARIDYTELSHGKQQLFQRMRRRLSLVFLHFSGKRMLSSVRQTAKRKENILYSGVFLAFSGLAISSELKKTTGVFFRVRGVLLVFYIFCRLDITKKGVFCYFLHPQPHPRSRLFPKFHDSKLLQSLGD